MNTSGGISVDHPLFNMALGNSASIHSVMLITFFFIFMSWLAYSLVAAYHWFKYGHQSWLAVPAIGIHLFISGLLIIFIATGFA